MLLKRRHVSLSGHLYPRNGCILVTTPQVSELTEATQRSTAVQKPLCEEPPEREDGSGGKPEGFP